MHITIDQQVVNPNIVTYNDGLNYGRFDSDNIEIHSYRFFVERDDLVEKFSAIYWDCSEQIRQDDEKYQESSSFQALRYVSLYDAFAHPEHLGSAIETFLDKGIFQLYIPSQSDFVHVINSTDKVVVTALGVTIEGRCFNHKSRR
jgi:hypothetical protein